MPIDQSVIRDRALRRTCKGVDVHVGALMRTLTARCARGRRCPRASDRVCVRMKRLTRRLSGIVRWGQRVVRQTRLGCHSETGGVAARRQVRKATYCRTVWLSFNDEHGGIGRSESPQWSPTCESFACGVHAVVGALPTAGVIAASAADARSVSVLRCSFGR